ncbi:hypothetical protein VE02_02458 [Pseudogymnoascus sp. 03VT05]|nr:hypothetical protein VE02_02458 [Pseudogymnoascus sp. 03VT05]
MSCEYPLNPLNHDLAIPLVPIHPYPTPSNSHPTLLPTIGLLSITTPSTNPTTSTSSTSSTFLTARSLIPTQRLHFLFLASEVRKRLAERLCSTCATPSPSSRASLDQKEVKRREPMMGVEDRESAMGLEGGGGVMGPRWRRGGGFGSSDEVFC